MRTTHSGVSVLLSPRGRAGRGPPDPRERAPVSVGAQNVRRPPPETFCLLRHLQRPAGTANLRPCLSDIAPRARSHLRAPRAPAQWPAGRASTGRPSCAAAVNAPPICGPDAAAHTFPPEPSRALRPCRPGLALPVACECSSGGTRIRPRKEAAPPVRCADFRQLMGVTGDRCQHVQFGGETYAPVRRFFVLARRRSALSRPSAPLRHHHDMAVWRFVWALRRGGGN